MTKTKAIKLFQKLFTAEARSFTNWLGMITSLLEDEMITERQFRSWKCDLSQAK